MKVNWDDDIPNIWKNNSHVPVTTNQIRLLKFALTILDSQIDNLNSPSAPPPSESAAGRAGHAIAPAICLNNIDMNPVNHEIVANI